MSKLFIGMAVYNGAKYISEAIDSIRNQSFEDWVLLISDNFSDDETEDICKKYIQLDPRIRYVRQISNIGGINNFKFLLDNADSEYFMWVASDDIWHKDYINICIEKLENDKLLGLAYANVISIDSYSNIIRNDLCLNKIVGKNKFFTALKFLWDPEIMGKACMVYGIYRTIICRQVWDLYPINNNYASDVSFVYGVLSRSKIYIDERILFHKRYERDDDEPNNPKSMNVKNPFRIIFSLKDLIPYSCDLIKVADGFNYKLFVVLIMILRLPIVLFNNMIK